MQLLEDRLASEFGSFMQRSFVRFVGRGTTALYVTLRAIAACDGTGEIILPDVICSTELDAVLLAGFAPRFADVTPDRFTLDCDDVYRKITPATRGVIMAHVFGNVMDTLPIKAQSVRIIEDAVQGLGGWSADGRVGTLGDISFTNFNPTKMIAGYGAGIATNDPNLGEALRHVSLSDPVVPYAVGRYAHYQHQVMATRSTLIRPFDASEDNIAQIRGGLARPNDNVARRNEKARYLRENLAGFADFVLPEVRQGDAIWRYTFAAPSRVATSWILRNLQIAGLSGSHLYPSLSDIFDPDSASHLNSASLAPRLINLWVDDSTSADQIARAIDVIRCAHEVDHRALKQP